MPISDANLAHGIAPIGFQRPGTAMVRCGPLSAKPWHERQIPLDGRHYVCAGRIFFKHGAVTPAHFEIATHTFDFLERASVRCHLNDAWYRLDEPELYEALGVLENEALPFHWLPDIPLDFYEPGPYPGSRYPDPSAPLP